MSVLPMKRLFIAALKKDRKPILESLQRLGAVEINADAGKELFVSKDGQTDTLFKQTDTSSAKATFEKNANLASQALAILDREVPVKAGMMDSFAGRDKMNASDYESLVTKRDKIMDMVYELNSLNKQKAEAEAEIPKLVNQREMLAPWLGFTLPLDYKGTKYTKAFIGTFPTAYDQSSLQLAFAEKAPAVQKVDISIISSNEEQTCVLIICHCSEAKETEDALRSLSFARPALPGVIPAEQEKSIAKDLAKQEEIIKTATNKIAGYADKRREITFIVDYFTMRADKYGVIGGLFQSKRVFCITGYIPERDIKSLDAAITSKFDCVVEYSTPSDEENVPVKLSNNAYAAPIEGVVSGYALPGKGEVDPTFLASIFYYGLYGLMLSDAAYGLIMVFATLFILTKFKGRLEEGTKRMLQMFFGCGIGTTIWGFIFGSFFGDVVPKFTETFFGKAVNLPYLLDPIKDPVTLLGIAFVIGIIHLMCGLGIALYSNLKQGKIVEAVFDVICWYLFFGGLLGLLLTTEMIQNMFKFTINFPQAVVTVFTVCALAGATGILVMGGRESKNPLKRLLKGLYALYGISGYLSDVLSYSRLLALGLATGVISQVFNTIAVMPGGNLFGLIFFIVIFVVGHTINILINALGAYVHTNRLEYVEFFGKFYNGGGKEFVPFAENTKYFTVKNNE
ncbi:MAG: V-type ATP synthase subunit I [Catonella sp.]|uniref:V-type ATP synthase subunit I n=1 Tax=Catonella sp. TaxID=2382125 RepID=UPI003FA0F061